MSEHTVSSHQLAINEFSSIISWKDSDELIKKCQTEIEEIIVLAEKKRIEEERNAREEAERVAAEEAAMKAEQERKLKKRKKKIIIGSSIAVTGLIFFFLFETIILPLIRRKKAESLISENRFEEAYTIYEELGDNEAIIENKKVRSNNLLNEEKYDEAYSLLSEIGDNEAITANKYDRAVALIEYGDYELAYSLLDEVGRKDEIETNKYNRAAELLESGNYDAAYSLLQEIGKNDEIMSNKYDRAVASMDSGDYKTAYKILNGLNYKDSESKLKIIEESDRWIEICPIGRSFFFGLYEQDNDTSNGEERIEWVVLARTPIKILAVSKYVLDCQQYNTSYIDTTWETSSLRKWLNEEFLNNAFATKEQNMIVKTTVKADYNSTYDIPNNDTDDKVFILSINEVEKYFSTKNKRTCAPTDYAIAEGVLIDTRYTKESSATCSWWLRSPGGSTLRAANVDSDGDIDSIGDLVYDENYSQYGIGVRPVMWINLES